MAADREPLEFVKMQGVGNDFVLIDRRGLPPLDGASFATRLCDRRFGIGADGLLIVADSTTADAAMWMHNPDGTPDFCGNGLRCVSRYAADVGLGGDLAIETRSGILHATVHSNEDGVSVSVEMGEPRFAPAEIPMSVAGERVVDYPLDVAGERLVVTALSTGTTHTVAFVDTLPDDDRFLRIGPPVEIHALFPERTSLMWTVVESRSRLAIRIWERGGGETLGCGSGACAAAVAARTHGWVDDDVTVASKGGELTIHWRPGDQILMTGPAEYVFRGRVPTP